MVFLRRDVIRAHPLPAASERVAVKQRKTSSGRGSLAKGTLEIFRFEAGIAVDVALSIARHDQRVDQRAFTLRAATGEPESETEIFLPIVTEKVAARRRVHPLRHHRRVRRSAHCESQSCQMWLMYAVTVLGLCAQPWNGRDQYCHSAFVSSSNGCELPSWQPPSG